MRSVSREAAAPPQAIDLRHEAAQRPSGITALDEGQIAATLDCVLD